MEFSLTLQMLLIIAGAAAAVISVLLYFMLNNMKERSRSSYDSQRNQARLSEMREFFESQLYQINHQLLSSEKRWREVNHLLLSAQAKEFSSQERNYLKNPLLENKNSFFLQMGIDPNNVSIEKNFVFVLTPFEKEFHEEYLAIKNACGDVGLRCVRGDEEQASGDILKHILMLIAKADFVIANISSRNPNVFYELGIAQAIGKDAILVARDTSGLAFDLQSQRVVLYKNTQDLPEKLKAMLLRVFVNRKDN